MQDPKSKENLPLEDNIPNIDNSSDNKVERKDVNENDDYIDPDNSEELTLTRGPFDEDCVQ